MTPLQEQAKEIIDRIMEDTSVPIEETAITLADIREHIDIAIESLGLEE